MEYIGTYNVRFNDVDYIDLVFLCNDYDGEPIINETDKISELGWYELDKLPENRGFHIDIILKNYINKIPYNTYEYEKTN